MTLCLVRLSLSVFVPEHGVLVGWACFCWERVRSNNLDYISNLSPGPDQL